MGILLTLFLLLLSYELWNHGSFNYFSRIGCKISELLNITFATTLNNIFVKPNGYKFGNPKDRVVYVLAINNRLKTLTPLALHVIKIFNNLNKGFLEKSIANRNHVPDLNTYRSRISQ